jgi:hypothetical protein
MEYCLLGYFAKLTSPILLLCQVHFAKKLSPSSFYHFAKSILLSHELHIAKLIQVHITELPVLHCQLAKTRLYLLQTAQMLFKLPKVLKNYKLLSA